MRRAFTMQLKPNCVELYKLRHDEIWPELVLLLTDYGIRDYHIYLASNQLTLFATCKVPENFDEEKLASEPVMRKWWDFMADLMLVKNDNEPVPEPMTHLFSLRELT